MYDAERHGGHRLPVRTGPGVGAPPRSIFPSILLAAQGRRARAWWRRNASRSHAATSSVHTSLRARLCRMRTSTTPHDITAPRDLHSEENGALERTEDIPSLPRAWHRLEHIVSLRDGGPSRPASLRRRRSKCSARLIHAAFFPTPMPFAPTISPRTAPITRGAWHDSTTVRADGSETRTLGPEPGAPPDSAPSARAHTAGPQTHRGPCTCTALAWARGGGARASTARAATDLAPHACAAQGHGPADARHAGTGILRRPLQRAQPPRHTFHPIRLVPSRCRLEHSNRGSNDGTRPFARRPRSPFLRSTIFC